MERPRLTSHSTADAIATRIAVTDNTSLTLKFQMSHKLKAEISHSALNLQPHTHAFLDHHTAFVTEDATQLRTANLAYKQTLSHTAEAALRIHAYAFSANQKSTPGSSHTLTAPSDDKGFFALLIPEFAYPKGSEIRIYQNASYTSL